MVSHADQSMDLKITGPASIDCSNEACTISNDKITITNAGTAGDCVHDQLAKNHVTLQSITYNESEDSIQVSVKYTFVPITIKLTHQSMDTDFMTWKQQYHDI